MTTNPRPLIVNIRKSTTVAKNQAKPKDITASLVHRRRESPSETQSTEGATASLGKLERKLAFDPLTFTMWGAVMMLITGQFFLMVAVSLS